MSFISQHAPRTYSLGEIVFDAKSGFASGETAEDGIVQVRMNNVTQSGRLDWTKVRKVPLPKKFNDALLARPNDILFNATNSPDLVGKSALFTGFGEPVTFSNHFIRVRVNPARADSGYVSRWLHRCWQSGIFSSMCKQWVNQASVSRDQLLALEVPLPPLAEQRRIAAILEQADDLRRKRREALKRQNKIASSLLDVALKDRRTSEIFVRLDSLVRSDDRINYGVVQPGAEVDDGTPLIRVENLVNNDFTARNLKKIARTIDAQYTRSRLKGDEILVACVGSVGAVALAQANHTGFNIARAVARVPINPSQADRVFILEWLKHPSTQKYFDVEIRAVAQPTLNIKQLCETPIPSVSLDVQRAFAHRVAEIDNLETFHRAHLAKLDALFAALQHRAFRGEL